MSCAAPEQGGELTDDDAAGQTVIEGQVLRDGEPVGAAYVRLLDASGEFAGEVQASPDGEFRFFAAPGEWRLRALSPRGNGDATVTAAVGRTKASVQVA